MKNKSLRDRINKMSESKLYDNLADGFNMVDVPIDHDAYKEKMKQILLIYSGYVFALVEERKHKMKESDLIKMTDDFVEKSFKKVE